MLNQVAPAVLYIEQGIYFAAKSGRMCAEAIVEGSENGTRMVNEADLRVYLDKWDKKYWGTYKVRHPLLARLAIYSCFLILRWICWCAEYIV